MADQQLAIVENLLSYIWTGQTTNSSRRTEPILGAELDGDELRAELEKHHCDSYGWALSCCGRNPDEAENVLQAAYLKALEGKARFNGRASFRTWLFAVIRRTAIEGRRRQWLRRIRIARYEEKIEHKSCGEAPDGPIHCLEIREMFIRALAELPRRQREVLQLVFYHDLSVAEAGKAMGVSLGSARTHYERGKQRMRQLMKGVELSDKAGR
ncbi:MAG: RNA polymerase sigma factor [Pirellulales bacterium]